MILSQIEREMLRQMDRDHQWDDQIDVGYPFIQRPIIISLYYHAEHISTYSRAVPSKSLQI
jgi:hypothetical protein